MTERCGDQIAKRVFVSVSKHSHQWSQAWKEDKTIVEAAINLINSNKTTPPVADADTMLVVKERWPMRIWIVFDVSNTTYDPVKAHLPGHNDLPVVAISLSKTASVTIASELVRDRVNTRVREAHDLYGDGSRAPFQIDHADGKIPTFPSPRSRRTVAPENKDE